MRVNDRAFLENYRDWAAENNLIAAKYLLEGINKETDIEKQKLLFIKLYFELINSGENLISLIIVARKHRKILGFRKALVHCAYKPLEVRNLFRDLLKYRRVKFKFFVEYLGLDVTEEDYNKDQMAFNGFYDALLAVLQNRTVKTRGEKGGLLLQAYNKIKHGFPIYSITNSKRVLIYLSKGRETQSKIISYDKNFAREVFDTIESVRNSVMNLTQLILEKGFKA